MRWSSRCTPSGLGFAGRHVAARSNLRRSYGPSKARWPSPSIRGRLLRARYHVAPQAQSAGVHSAAPAPSILLSTAAGPAIELIGFMLHLIDQSLLRGNLLGRG